MVYPYDPRELIAFAGIGVVCGMGGALYVYVHRRYVLWMRGNKKLTKFLQKNRFIYPFLISFMITAVTFPNFLGQFIASKLNTHDQVLTLPKYRESPHNAVSHNADFAITRFCAGFSSPHNAV